ncbi:MAG: type II toxin-antitoxin system YafQ family toxin [Clostridiales bacterium]|nr:type II toxin-antitoxin system YafQ family toxin [Clostridiales bacterium]
MKIEYTTQFKKDYKLAKKRGLDTDELAKTVDLLLTGEPLPEGYHDHELNNSKQYKNVRECHIQPDWLLIYQIIGDNVVLRLLRTGSHSDLF